MIEEDSLSDNEASTRDTNLLASDEIIGHMQSRDGENLGELVVVNKTISKTKVRNKTGKQ